MPLRHRPNRNAWQVRLAVVCLFASTGATSQASEFSGTVALTSEYVFRGLALSDGDPSFQAGVDYAHDSGLFAGAWGSTIDRESPSGSRDLQVNYYAGYHYAPESRFAASLSVTRYTYPGQPGPLDYDYTEMLVAAYLDDRYSLEFGYSDSLYGFDVNSRHLELRADWPLRSAWVIGGGVGYNDVGSGDSDDYLYWDAGVTGRYSRLTMDLRWYDNETPDGFFRSWSAGSQLVATLSLAF